MTDPATIEKIARRYCELMGLDSDENMACGYGIRENNTIGTFWKKRWEISAPLAAASLAMSTAIKEVMKDE